MVVELSGRACLVLLVLGVGGCAGRTGGWRSAHADLRQTLVVSDPEPRLIVAGPARLLHLRSDRRAPVVVFRVPRHDGTAADCFTVGTQASSVVMPARGWLEIPKNESMCAMVSRRASLSWHVERFTEAPTLPEPAKDRQLAVTVGQ